MTTLDDSLPAEVAAVLATYGKDVIFSVPIGKTYNEATGGLDGGYTQNYPVKAAPPYEFSRQYVNGTTIQEGDVRILIAKPADFTPAISHKVIFDSQTFNLVSVSPIYSGENVVAYECIARA